METSEAPEKYVNGMVSHGVDDDRAENDSDQQMEEQGENAPGDEMGEQKELRIIRKAKRTGITPNSNDGIVTGAPSHVTRFNGVPLTNRKNKQVKHSRGRAGEPKKGGAGGKGVWGKPGSEIDDSAVDINDPNYDSDSQGEWKLEEVEPVLTDDQLDKILEPMLQEYLEHGKTNEVEALLGGLSIGGNRHRIAKKAIELGMDRHNAQREMISRLISDLYDSTLSSADIAKSLHELLAALDDLVIDIPDAHNLLGQFIARCVADDCLPPKFITSYKGSVESHHVISALEKAEVLLSMNHGIAHLDNIWGVGGGNRPVRNLTKKIVELLKEYKDSEDGEEAMRCLKELEVPHFHHELVYQACILAIEDSSDRALETTVRLLKILTDAAVVTIDQFEKGAKRLYSDIHDIALDVPAAHNLLEQLGIKLHEAGVLSKKLLDELPSKGRKRFVSEGDSGIVKSTF